MGMPFRDEKESLIAKNATLEAENAKLRDDLERVRRPPPASGQRGLTLFVAALVTVALTGGAVFVLLGTRLPAHERAPEPAVAHSLTAQPGIAIAPPSPDYDQAVTGESSAAAAAPVRPRGTSERCTCTPGDPLCSCWNPPKPAQTKTPLDMPLK